MREFFIKRIYPFSYTRFAGVDFLSATNKLPKERPRLVCRSLTNQKTIFIPYKRRNNLDNDFLYYNISDSFICLFENPFLLIICFFTQFFIKFLTHSLHYFFFEIRIFIQFSERIVIFQKTLCDYFHKLFREKAINKHFRIIA